MENITVDETQQALCDRFGAQFCVSPETHTLRIARNARSTMIPINGLRHPPTSGVTGWYIWAGENLLEAADFFVRLASHIWMNGVRA
jgi:hypothetical protein